MTTFFQQCLQKLSRHSDKTFPKQNPTTSKHWLYRIRRNIVSCLFCFFCLCPLLLYWWVAPSYAVEAWKIPDPRIHSNNWVADTADLLSPETEAELNRSLSRLEADTTAQMVVVAVPDIAPEKNSKDFAVQLFNLWRIGAKKKNNGVLFLISKGDRRVEIRTGYDIPQFLSNTEVKRIVDEVVVPLLRQGNYDKGTLDGTRAVIAGLEAHAQQLTSAPLSSSYVRSSASKGKAKNPVLAAVYIGAIAVVISALVLICAIALFRSRKSLGTTYDNSGYSFGSFNSSDGSGGSCGDDGGSGGF